MVTIPMKDVDGICIIVEVEYQRTEQRKIRHKF
jgi:hypothetical protein